MSLELIEAVADLFEIPIASLFIESGKKNTPTIRNMELQVIEKQLQENVAENIAKAFKRLK